LGSSLTGKRDGSMGSSVVGADATGLLGVGEATTTCGATTSPERHASGVGSAVTESSDLGRKGRAGATVVIFTAGMDDLRGQFFLRVKKGTALRNLDRFNLRSRATVSDYKKRTTAPQKCLLFATHTWIGVIHSWKLSFSLGQT